jgi:hypothetical protein
MLKDIRWWFDNHPDVKVTASSSNFVKCRKYYTLLLTDGAPNLSCGYSDASKNRPEICFRFGSCTTDADCPAPSGGKPREWFCVANASGNRACQHVSYNEPDMSAAAQRAADLFNPPGGGKSVTVHVIGFNLPSAITCNGPSDCPLGQTCTAHPSGGSRCSCATDANCEVGETCTDVSGFRQCMLGGAIESIAAAGGGQAFLATDPETLRTSLNQIFSAVVPETTARTRPTSTSAVAPLSQLPSRFPQPQAEGLFLFQGAFRVPSASPYWRGFLQRTSIGNKGTADSPIIGPIEHAPGRHGTVFFDELLNTQPNPVDDQGVSYTRKIYTWKNGQVVEFTRANIAPADLGVATSTQRDQVVDFIRGEVGTAMATQRLGAVYHSSPVVLEPPVQDLPLTSYRIYQADARIRERPPMVFVGSNLGMLHAFNGQTGKEEWAFIPPILLQTLKNQLLGFTFGVDATPSARDIQLTTLNETSDPLRNWRAVVTFGLGNGGQAYVALDVTDPVWRADNNPPFKFLWQFDNTVAPSSAKLGTPYGSPEVGTVFLDDPGSGYPFQERAIAILPGGKKPVGQGIGGNQGESIWVLDLATGAVLKRFDGTPGGGGMTGSCAAVDDFPGSFITRAFCGDNRGQISRIDLASPLIANWSVSENPNCATGKCWYDLYQGSVGGVQQPIFLAPTLAFRANGNLMVIVGNGDPYDLQSLDSTRLGFIEEVPSFDSGGNLTGFSAQPRKIQIFQGGEKITSSPVVANGIAYFATFIPDVSETCSFGRSRLWGVDFDDFDSTGTCTSPDSGSPCFIGKLESKCGPDRVIDTGDDAPGTTTFCTLSEGSVTFGFDIVRTPSATTFASVGQSGAPAPGEGGGSGLKLVFQTGASVVTETSNLRDPELTPPGAQKINVGSIVLPDVYSRVRTLSWARVRE